MTALRHETPFQAGMLEWLDQHDVRYEIIDGLLVVSPQPRPRHGRHAVAILAALHAAAPEGLDVFGSDLAVYYDRTAFETSYLVPDVSVVRADELGDDEEGLYRVPLLVVEVLSPSTRRTDLLLKKDIYRELGVPSYWLVDPVQHLLTVLTLQAGEYVETARGTRLELVEPFPVIVDLG